MLAQLPEQNCLRVLSGPEYANTIDYPFPLASRMKTNRGTLTACFLKRILPSRCNCWSKRRSPWAANSRSNWPDPLR